MTTQQAAFKRQLQIQNQVLGRRKPKAKMKRPPKWAHPDGLCREYSRALVSRASMLQLEIFKLVGTRIEDWRKEARADDWVDDMNELMVASRLQADIIFQDAPALAYEYGVRTSDFNRAQFQKILTAVIGVAPLMSEPWLETKLKSFQSQNVTLIRTIPERLLTDVNGIVQRGINAGTLTRDIQKQLAQAFNTSDWIAERIARDQIGKFNGQLTELRQTDLGIKKYKWRGALDEREREEHLAREGKTFAWNKPPSDGNPGEPILCRCYAEPDLSELVDFS